VNVNQESNRCRFCCLWLDPNRVPTTDIPQSERTLFFREKHINGW